MKFKITLLSLLIFGMCANVFGQGFCPDNIDFEDGSLVNWIFYRGTNTGTATTPPVWTLTAGPARASLHTLESGTGTDAYGGFPIVAPGGGSYSLRLGKDSTEYNADGASYYLHIPPGTTAYSLIYKYAMVLENPPTTHTPFQMPRMVIFAIDSATNDTLPCAKYTYVSAATDPGFVGPISYAGHTDVYYKNWTTGNMKFPGENGRTVTVTVIVGGCTEGGHFGYGYFDMSCGAYAVSIASCGTSTDTLSAPPGYSGYHWYDSATFSTSYGTTQVVAVSVPTASATYAVVLTPYTGYGCLDTLYTRIVPTDLVLSPSHDTSICRGASVTLTSGATDIVSLSYAWSPASGLSCTTCASPVATPTVTTRYAVLVTDAGGCSRSDTITVTVYANPVPISGLSRVCTGNNITLTDTSSGGRWSSSSTGIATIGTSSGILTSVSVGTTVISYTIGGICTTTATETVNPSPPPITGTLFVCPFTSTTLSDTMSGGTWSSGSTGIATAGSSTGIITGVTAGTAIVTYKITLTGCIAVAPVTVNPLPSAISGITSLCAGTTSSFTDASGGGAWSSGNAAVGTVNSSGAVYGISAGTTAITYTLATGCLTSITVTVNPLPTAIFGTFQTCPGESAELLDATSGGTWSCSDVTVASLTSSSGIAVATGVAAGTVTITYKLSATGCLAIASFTVNPTPPAISGITSICLGSTTLLSDLTSGGTWTTSSVTTAPVGFTTGVVTGLSLGLPTITYTLPTGCYTTVGVTIYPNPAPITGTTTLCVGNTSTLADATPTGSWWSSNSAVAPVVSSLGLVTGSSAGTAIITYLLSTGCYITTTVTVLPSPSAISGPTSVCVGTTATLTDGIGGGTWTSSHTAVAIIGSSTGIVTGVSAGTAVITYSLGGTCRSTRVETVLASPSVVTGIATVCAGSTTTLADGTGGGTWSSGSIGVATVGTSGIVTGVSSGTAVITYKIGDGCAATDTVAVYLTPTAIAGTLSVCIGASSSLTDLVSGGTWSSSNTAVATIGSSSGITDGVSVGTAVITYMIGSCRATATITVNPLPASITGTLSVCAGTTTTLGDVTTGGTWSSGATSIATVGTGTGIVAGILSGTSVISYKLPTGCIATATVTVSPTPDPITGAGSLCSGTTTGLGDLVGGGTWSSSNISMATVGSSTGIVDGVSGGTSVITYSLGGSCIVVKTVMVYASPTAPTGPHALCIGATTTLGDSVSSGTWISGSTSVATVGVSSGLVTAVALGTTIITYTAPGGCTVNDTISVSPTPLAIVGVSPVCAGTTVLYTDPVSGGLWTSSAGTVAAIGSTSGLLTGVSVGVATITYSLGSGCTVYKSMTVIASPSGITGTTSICVGATTTLADGTGGGTWSSGNTAVATVSATGGVVSGVSAGTAIISYIVPSGCYATATVTVSPTPGTIGGPSSLCSGTTISLSDGVSGGAWSSSNTTVGTVGTTGVVTGVSAGTAVISYTLGGSCSVTKTITVYASPTVISGSSALCMGATMTLTDGISGGTWLSGSSAVATIGLSSGIVFGASFGSTTVTYSLPGGCSITTTITVSPTPTPITGTLSVCAGSTTTLDDGVPGGGWVSGNTAVATTGSLTGIVTGIAAGTTIITYSLGSGCTATATVTVLSSPAGITGTASVCVGNTTDLSDATSLGTWSSSSGAVATVGASSGVVDGVSAGTATITYSIGDGCMAIKIVTVNPLPAPISGTLNVCVGSTTDLGDLTGGGTWASGSTSVASVGLASGIVSGISAGNAVITYILPGGCYTTATVTVNAAPPAIGGTTSLCAGSTTILTDLTGGGSWLSSNTAVATIGSTSGVVYGVGSGTAIVTYTLSDGCTAMTTITVKTSPSPIIGATNMCVSTTIDYSDLVSGGAWTSSNTSVATIGLSSGIIYGVSIGTSIITTMLATGCYVTQLLTVNPSATAIVVPAHICTGSCYTLTDAVSGGTWVSTSTGVATIVSSSGLLCGVSAGSTTITYSLGAGCTAWATVGVNVPPAGITGTMSLCQGTTTTLSDVTIPGTWTSGSTAVATVGAGTGIVAGVSGGTAMITFVIANGCTATAEVTVNPVAAITGPAAICQGQTATMADAVPGGTWESSDATVASIDISAGTVIGMSSGSSVITYTTPGGCTVTKTITVNPIPDPITGITNVCIGQTTDLSDLTGGVTWSSSSTGIATIGVTSGIVSGISAGTSVIVTRLATGCQVTDTITVNPLPEPITGAANVCSGSATTLSDGVPGGSWSISGASTIGSASGIVTGMTGTTASTAIVTYTLGSGCIVARTITINPAPAAITGADHLCVGQSTGLSDATAGGTWTSSAPLIASVGASTGVVNGLSEGTATIIYSVTGTGCAATLPFTVISLPSVIGGTLPLCDGATETLVDSTTGGAWSSSDTSIATIDASSGAATGMSSGTVLISYTLGTGCMAISSIIINPMSPVDGPSTVCAGQTILVSDTTTGGTWSSSATSIATVFSAGDTTALVSGILAGTATIYYTLPTGCTAAKVITVAPAPDAIFGASEVCAGQTIALTDGTTGGAWSSSATGVATVSGGIVTGVMEGTTEISYTAGGCPATKTVTVNPLPAAIAGNTGVCLGTTTSLTDATSGGAWSSSTTVIASVSGVGVVTGWATGTAIITYRLGTGCIAADTINVNPAPGAISGSVNFCVGYTDTLSDGTTGGTWGSSATGVATVSSAGVVTGVSAGSAIITYALGTGCEATTTVNVYSLPPAISGSPQVCVGSTDTLGDAATGGAWISGSTSVATVTSGTGVVTGIAAGTTAITYTLGAGCTVTAAITVNPPPMAIAGTPLQLCQGASATVYDASSPGTWSSLNPTIATVDATSGLVSGINAGSTIITYTLLTTGCTAEGTVTVFAQPTVFTGNLTICLGTTSDLSESVSGGAWYSLEPTVATVTSASAGSIGEVFGASLGTAEISYILGAGCSMQATVEVVPLPGAFAVTGGGNFCADSAGVDVGLAGSGTGTNYLLYRGSTALGAFAGTGYPINFGRQTVGGIYTVEAINTTTGCTNLMSGSANVIVIPTVTPAVGIASGSGDTVCAGASVTYTALPVNGGTGPAYQWNVNGVNVGTGGIYTYIPAAGDVVKVTLTSDASCPLPDTASHELTMDVEALQNPLVSFSASPGDTVCNGMAVTLTASPVYGGATPAFTWKKDGAVIGSGPVFTYVPANGDMITCFMTSDYLCLVTDTVTGPAMVMTVDNPIIPTVTISANPGTTVGIGKSATLTAEVTNGGTDPTYQWYINGVPVPGATAQSFTKSNFDTLFEDSVSVVVTSSGVCPMSTHNWVYIQVSDVGVRNIQGGSDISVLPNPSKGTFTIKGTVGAGNEEVTVEVTDLLGQSVYQTKISAQGGRINEQVTLGNNIANGMYILNLHTDTDNMVFHIVVEQ